MSKAWPVSWARSWAFWLCESLLVTWVYKMNNKPLRTNPTGQRNCPNNSRSVKHNKSWKSDIPSSSSRVDPRSKDNVTGDN